MVGCEEIPNSKKYAYVLTSNDLPTPNGFTEATQMDSYVLSWRWLYLNITLDH
jgi:hypothetical protein